MNRSAFILDNIRMKIYNIIININFLTFNLLNTPTTRPSKSQTTQARKAVKQVVNTN